MLCSDRLSDLEVTGSVLAALHPLCFNTPSWRRIELPGSCCRVGGRHQTYDRARGHHQSRGIELTNLQESSSIGLSSQALPKQSRAGSSEMLALTARPLTAGAPRQRRQRRVECACQAPAESWRRAALCRHHCWAWRCRRGQAAERAGRLAVSSSRHWPSWSHCGRIACARSSIAPEVRRSPPIFTCTRSRRHIAPKVATLTS